MKQTTESLRKAKQAQGDVAAFLDQGAGLRERLKDIKSVGRLEGRRKELEWGQPCPF